jgi:hypothetical protein
MQRHKTYEAKEHKNEAQNTTITKNAKIHTCDSKRMYVLTSSQNIV